MCESNFTFFCMVGCRMFDPFSGSSTQLDIGTKNIDGYMHAFACTPQPLYNTIAGVQANFHVSYPFRVITRVKHIDIIAK